MARIETWYKQDLKRPVKVQTLMGNVFTLDNVGSLIGVEVFSDGVEETLTGAATGYCILPDGTTISVPGTRSGNKAYILLPQSALAYPGLLKITVKLTNGNEITTLLAVIATVARSRTDAIITPSQQIITDWSQQIAAKMQAVEDASAAQDAKIDDLKSAIGAGLLTKSPYLTQGYIDSTGKFDNMVSGSDRSSLIPVNGGESFSIQANTLYTYYAALKSFDSPATGDTPDYSSMTGWTNNLRINANTSVNGTLPSDAKFLLIYLGKTSANLSRKPLSVDINGYDYVKTIAENIRDKSPIDSPAFTGNPTAPTQAENDNSTKLATTAYADRAKTLAMSYADERIVTSGIFMLTDAQYIHKGIIINNGQWQNSSNQYYALIPIKAGDELWFSANASGNGNFAVLRTYAEPVAGAEPDFSEASEFTNTITIIKGTSKKYIMPDDAQFLYVYLRLLSDGAYERMPVSLMVNGYDYVKGVCSSIGELYSLAPLRIRVMQYNLGHFNMGQPVGNSQTTYYLTSANYSSVLAAYKALFEKYAPDIVGFDEFDNSVFVKGVDGASDATHDMDEELFDLYFPYSDESSTAMSSRRATKSKYAFTDTQRKQVTASYTYDGVDYSFSLIVVYSHVTLKDKTIALVTTPYPSTNNSYTQQQNELMKKAAFQAVVDLCANDDNAILISDTNAAPELQETIMNDVLGPAGYNAVVGGYLRFVRWPVTWKSYTSGTELSIDNFFVKGDLIPVNYGVLWSLRDSLASDHAPVYADFLLF